jgi:hypothetical protein
MSQPYGQQPGDLNQPGQGFGGMPPAPQEYSAGPVARPGTTTTAAVLSFVQGGLTLICSIILMAGLGALTSAANDESIGGIDVNGGMLAFLWILAIVGLVGAGLLIWAGVKALSGTSGPLMLIANGLQILLCIVWLIQGGGIISILLAVMPIISIVMMLGAPAKQYEASRVGR